MNRLILARLLPLVLPPLLLGGCDEEPMPTAPPLPDHGTPPNATDDPLGARLHARGLSRVRRLAPDGPVLRGRLSQGEVDGHAHVLLGTHCYSFLAVGSEGVEELDLILVDPTGAPVKHDEAQGPDTDLGVTTSLCPMEPGMYRIRVRMFRGEGEYAMRAFAHQVI